jgi:hypothetical protein
MASVDMRTPVRRPWDRARFYWIHGRQLPSVTTVLEVIAKPALGPWYAKEERRQLETALLEVLVQQGPADREAYKAFVLEQLAGAITGVKAADRARELAATIGTAVHAGIEWHLRTQLGEDAGAEPLLPEAAAWAVESWKDWAKSVALEPLALERVVYCEDCGYAGTLDLYARVKGIPTVLDWKTGRAIYPEALLQARVSAALAALPRGPEPSPPGERFRRAVLSAMPDIDAMEVAERFFALGAQVVGSPHPVAIFLAGCRECLAEWEVQAARGRRAPAAPPEDRSGRHDGTAPSPPLRSDRTPPVRPRGQNGSCGNGHGGH